jgi:peptidoglycan/LPS O-acetylase OafA/YrhL
MFVAQSIIFYTAGISLFLHLRDDRGATTGAANTAVFFVGTFATLAFATAYWYIVDQPSQKIAKAAYLWLME